MPENLGGRRVSQDEAIGEAVKAKDAASAASAKLEQVARENKLLRKERDEAKKQLETYLSISENVPLFEIPRFAGSKSGDSISVPIFLWSDWHCEEEVKPEAVRGKNEFNLEIADKRIDRLIDKSVSFAKARESHTDVPEAILWLGGDFITGHIHEEFMVTNQLTPPEAILWVKKRILSGIVHLSQSYPKVRVVCNTGNHGRTTKKKVSSGLSQRTSFEWLMYHTLKEQVLDSGIKNVEFHIPESYFAEFNVFGFRVRAHHGDNLLYGGGIGGPSIPINKAISEWNIADHVDFDYFGHLHQAIDHHIWQMNGSLIGYNPFAIDIKARFQRPLQIVDFIHHRVGRTDTIKVYLD